MIAISHKFAALTLLGIVVTEDADQPGKWIWISTKSACKASFASHADAINDAFEACLLGLVTDLSNSADDTGCEDCYVVDDSVVDNARSILQAVGVYPAVTGLKLTSPEHVEALVTASVQALEVLDDIGCELSFVGKLDAAINAVRPAS